MKLSKMEKLGYYNKETGEQIESDTAESMRQEDYLRKVRRLQWLFENKPEDMTLDEVKELRKIYTKSSNSKVKLEYSDGFYMIANNTEDNLRTLSLDTCGFLLILGFNINKSGVAVYKNNKNINSFNDLREFIGVTEKVWRRVKKEIDSLGIIKKETFDNKICLILNPMYMGNAYEVTEVKFYCFNDYFKENLSPIDYLYLSKQWDICL